MVDFDDFRQWKDNFPGANGAVGAAASVPEPASMVLVFLTLPWILRRRK
ncbi:MAG: PEP-CTERM sorting domain-containing protein [Planctomycetales bacterium]|nr:PEP-CTERM sorting domain-containing protein [Planctomycetales bacterium]